MSLSESWFVSVSHSMQVQATRNMVLKVKRRDPWLEDKSRKWQVLQQILQLQQRWIWKVMWLKSWQIFLEQWQNYEIATALNTADSKVCIASFLSALGDDAICIYRHLPLMAADEKHLSKIQRALAAHFKPVLNVSYERYVFGMYKQEPHESIEECVTKLQKLSETCSFGDLRNDFIKDWLVLGINNNSMVLYDYSGLVAPRLCTISGLF